ncbi:MAG: hypothetical protein WEC83_00230 [Patescibacteria group bacterium]
MSIEGASGSGPEDIGAGQEQAAQWGADSARAEAQFENHTEQEPADREQLINEQDPDRLIEAQLERERYLLDAVGKVHEASIAELAERYKINDGNAFLKFIKNASAWFAGEFRDIELAKEMAGKEGDEREEIKKAFSFFSRENARRVAKNITKTAVTGGIGAGITAILGGAVASPAFGFALLGGFAARGAVELWRQLDPDEREARFKAIEARSDVFAYAAQLQQEAGTLLAERENASRERKAEIDAEIDNMHLQLVAELKYKSEEAIYSDGDEGEKATIRGMEKVFELGKEKNTLERKREKISDLIAAGGSLAGGIFGSFVTETLTHTTKEAAQGFTANFDKIDPAHFVQHVTPDQIQHADPGFAKLLQESGGYVFQYNPGELAAKSAEAAKYGYELTTATLTDGKVVHVLNGMTNSRFAELLAQHSIVSKEVITQTTFNLAGFFKEAVPLAASNAAFFVRNLYAGRNEPPGQEQSVTDQAWEQWEAGAAAAQKEVEPEPESEIPGTGPKYGEEVRVPVNGGSTVQEASPEVGTETESVPPPELNVEEPKDQPEVVSNESGVFGQYEIMFEALRHPESKGSWEDVEAQKINVGPGVESHRIAFIGSDNNTYICDYTIDSRRDAKKRDSLSLMVFSPDNEQRENITEVNQQQLQDFVAQLEKKRKKR